MERRMLLAVLLSFFVVTLYSMATGQCQPPQKPEGDEIPVDGAEGDGRPGRRAPAPGPDDPAPGARRPRSPAAGAPAR